MTVVTHPAEDWTRDAWQGFSGRRWRERVDVPDFVRANYTPDGGGSGFPAGPTPRGTREVWAKVAALFPEERRCGILDVDVSAPSTITSHVPGYIDRERELTVGLQTDAPLKRAIMPNGGLRMVVNGLRSGTRPRPTPSSLNGSGGSSAPTDCVPLIRVPMGSVRPWHHRADPAMLGT